MCTNYELATKLRINEIVFVNSQYIRNSWTTRVLSGDDFVYQPVFFRLVGSHKIVAVRIFINFFY